VLENRAGGLLLNALLEGFVRKAIRKQTRRGRKEKMDGSSRTDTFLKRPYTGGPILLKDLTSWGVCIQRVRCGPCRDARIRKNPAERGSGGAVEVGKEGMERGRNLGEAL